MGTNHRVVYLIYWMRRNNNKGLGVMIMLSWLVGLCQPFAKIKNVILFIGMASCLFVITSCTKNEVEDTVVHQEAAVHQDENTHDHGHEHDTAQPATGSSSSGDYDEGIEYKLVSPPVRSSSESKIEVVELFWYGCPHCYSFDPKLAEWKKDQGENIEFVRVPAIFPNRPVWELHARAFYTAELLGVLDKIHTPLFDAIHKQRRKLFNQAALADFFSEHGVDKAVFNDTMQSFGVQMKINRAMDLTTRYQIDGVPTLIIDGRYRTHASLTSGQAGLLKVTDFLIKKASTAKK
jgi:thiol:disulfide interchange protein DsbA